MNLLLVPGYKSLFGDPDKTYEQLVTNIPSEMIISLAIMLNNELDADNDDRDNQTRLFELIVSRYSQDQLLKVVGAYRSFSQRFREVYRGYIFGRRYLIAYILKELARNKQLPQDDSTPEQEFDFLIAYLMVIDEVNDNDSKITNEIIHQNDDPLKAYKLIWPSVINQYLFNNFTDFPYELYKTACFLKYAAENYRPYLKVFLGNFNFETIGNYFYSFYQVAMATTKDNKDSVFHRLNFITPVDGVSQQHLDSQSINPLIGTSVVFSDIKKLPLFKNNEGKFMIIDHDAYLNKSYKGTYFELRTKTDLINNISYQNYSTTVAANVLERIVFKSIVDGLRANKYDCFHYDDSTDSVPDAYIRHNQTVFLIEFKAYLFPDEIPANPSFETIKNYIDTRFIANQEGQGKGITQLANQIKLLLQRHYAFDEKFTSTLYKKKISIYPIICADDFYFTIPGINEYLNDRFQALIANLGDSQCQIHNLTMINLNRLFYLNIHKKTIVDLQESIDQFRRMIKERKNRFEREPSIDAFLHSKASFDELFFKLKTTSLSKKERAEADIIPLLNKVGVTDELLQEIIL